METWDDKIPQINIKNQPWSYFMQALTLRAAGNAKGFMDLITWMKELRRRLAKTDVIFGIEPAGHYWFPLVSKQEKT